MIEIRVADLSKPEQGKALVYLLNQYAQHPMGGGQPLSTYTRINLAATLQQRSDCSVILAFDDERAVGLCNCFECFSTFACKPILNIHDIYVEQDYRGQGLAGKMMAYAEQLARDKGCCKVTLEVLTNNMAAKTAYQAAGYAPYQLDAEFGQAEFWQKPIE